MGDAAYDPLFWAHHAMVDRLWRLWQLQHTGVAFIDRDLLDVALCPFPMTVRRAPHGPDQLGCSGEVRRGTALLLTVPDPLQPPR